MESGLLRACKPFSAVIRTVRAVVGRLFSRIIIGRYTCWNRLERASGTSCAQLKQFCLGTLRKRFIRLVPRQRHDLCRAAALRTQTERDAGVLANAALTCVAAELCAGPCAGRRAVSESLAHCPDELFQQPLPTASRRRRRAGGGCYNERMRERRLRCWNRRVGTSRRRSRG